MCCCVNGKANVPSATRPNALGSLVKHHNKGGRALGCGSAAHTRQIAVDAALLVRSEPGNVEGSPGISPKKLQIFRRGSKHSWTSVSASMPCCAASNIAA